VKAKKIKPQTKVVTPEELWKQSGLSREEWNEQLIRQIKELEAEGKKNEAFNLVLMLIDSDGKSVMTKLTEAALVELANENSS